ncbi:MAG: type II toxin-antitoxin system prevent-host-death family antitoxin [Roseiflexaceae bacterium]|jgi:prevent-host-death family protein
MTQSWQLDEAPPLPAIVAQAVAGAPQLLTVDGVAVAVVLSYAEYQRLTAPLSAFMQRAPTGADEIAMPRDYSPLRADPQLD